MPNVVKVILAVLGLLLVSVMGSCMITTVDADEIVVKQGAFDGSLTVWSTPGPKFQNFGTITKYKRSVQYSFSAAKDQGDKTDQSIKARFNDGGHGRISGTLRYDLPLDPNKMVDLHKKYHSPEAIDQALIRPVVERSIYMTGPLMSSKESAAERRSDLLKFIEDQAGFGVYQTVTKDEKVVDSITGKEKTIAKVELVSDNKGGFLRQESSPLETFGVHTYSYNINGVEYDKDVEDQIKGQQKLAMDIQTAIAQSKEAEQRALTVAKEGEANAAKAKWEQEVLKAKEVTKAEQDKAVALTNAQREKEVAELAVQTAELKKREQTLLGEGEASRARAMMVATGYLPEKLAAWKAVASIYAEQSGKQRQTPDVVMGGSGGKPDLSDIMQMSLAKQLNLGGIK